MDFTERFKFMLGTGFGSGLLPVAPGTWGSLAALAVGWTGIHYFGAFAWFVMFPAMLAAGWFSAPWFIARFSSDPPAFVMDEWAGQVLPLLVLIYPPFLPFISSLGTRETLLLLGSMFLIFRFFDIFKPLGIRKLEALEGANGVMFDDLLAGFYTFTLLFIVIFAVL